MAEITGVEITTYYTPVQNYYEAVDMMYMWAWPDLSTTGKKISVGPLPRKFVNHLKNEGTGLMTAGLHGGKFLNYSFEGLGPNGDQAGYWVDTCPRDAYGGCLKTRITAAVSNNLARNYGMKRMTAFRITDCGSERDNIEACRYFKEGFWVVNDQFTTGIASEKQIDLYYGLQDRKDFRTSPFWMTMQNAKVQI